MPGTALGVFAGFLELSLAGSWFWLAYRVRIPKERRWFLVLHGVGLVLGVGAFALGTAGAGTVFATIGIFMAATFLGLSAQSAQADLTPAAAVGSPIIEFTAPDHTGKPFDLATLSGKPFLLKFFRGHW